MGKTYCMDVGKRKREESKLIFKLGSLGKWKIINNPRKYRKRQIIVIRRYWI